MPTFSLQQAEAARTSRQARLDGERSAKERNVSGQFATPTSLARDVMRHALTLHTRDDIDFLEPSCGTGAFFSALLTETGGTHHRVRSASGVELDARFAETATEMWGPHGFDVVNGDFFDTPMPRGQVSLLVANPPYVRHHHLPGGTKRSLAARCRNELGIATSGLSGLYLYFLLLSHATMAPGCVAAWLIPSEFLDTNYGSALRRYLAERVTVSRIHRFDPEGTQFDDALVTSCVVTFTNTPAPAGHLVEFTEHGTVCSPGTVRAVPQHTLNPDVKWSPLFNPAPVAAGLGPRPRFDEFFTIKRGIATGNNKFFILDRDRVETLGIGRGNVTPILPSPKTLDVDIVRKGSRGYPANVKQIAVLTPKGTLQQLADSDPALAEYLGGADEKTLNSYLVSKRSPWYKMEHRDPAPFLLSYMGRSGGKSGRPFRFILNHSDAIATNMFLMLYPKGALKDAIGSGRVGLGAVFEGLRGVSAEALVGGGRVYGGGLRKIEPGELAALDATPVADLIPGYTPRPAAETLF